MLDEPICKASSMTEGKRVCTRFGYSSINLQPSTDGLGCPVTRAIQSFQSTTRVSRSSTMMPTSNASNTAPNSKMAWSTGILTCLLLDALDEVGHDLLKCDN